MAEQPSPGFFGDGFSHSISEPGETFTCSFSRCEVTLLLKKWIVLFGMVVAVSITARLSRRFVSGVQLEPADNRPNIVRPTNQSSWTAHHRDEPPPPTGAKAIGNPGAAHAWFKDIAEQAGLRYRWTIEGPRPLDILQTIGNGCAFLDYNKDGNLDILLIGSRIALYKGDGHGHFTDVTLATGLGKLSGHFLGCAVGDYDNDGYDDLYISGYRTGLLLHNEHGVGFRDVTLAAGLKPQPWGTSCAFGDIDNDGRLDLYVGGYVKFDAAAVGRLCTADGKKMGCSPTTYRAEEGVLYHNAGKGKFTDVTHRWKAETWGKTLAVGFADFDGTGRQSLMVANDTEPGDLLQNQGKAFKNIGRESATAYDGSATIYAGMGLDWGDFDNDGKLDLTVTTFHGQAKCVFHNVGHGLFEEISTTMMLTHYTMDTLAFGIKWIDYDNDGWLDLMIANGHVYDNISDVDKSQAFLQPTQLFHNDHGRLFVDRSTVAGPGIQKPILGRGLAVGDFDNDGRMDALAVDGQGAPLLLHNESTPVGHWLLCRLVGTKSNRDGYGAMVTAIAGGQKLLRRCGTDGSYLSASDPRVHFGLGKATSASVTVRWPGGSTSLYKNLKADRIVTLTEGGSATPR